MGLKAYRPTSPGRRGMTAVIGEDIAKKRPEKSLTESRRSSGGRNNDGRMTVRARGSGHKRLYRLVDFKRDKVGVPARVVAIEYDPNRSARLALLHYVDGEKRAFSIASVAGACAGRGDEARRSSSWRRGGQVRPGEPSSRFSVGAADEGVQDPAEQGDGQVHHRAA